MSKYVTLDEYLAANKKNIGRESVPRPIVQPAASYPKSLCALFDASGDEMTEEERRFYNLRHQTFTDKANVYVAQECGTQDDINQFFIRCLARQDAAIDRMERKFTMSVAAAVEAEIDIFLGNKPTVERIRGVNRRLNQMQLELKTFKDEVKAHPDFSGNPEDVKARKAALAAAAGVANQSKKRKKVAGTAEPVGQGAGQGPDGLDQIYESLINVVSTIQHFRAGPSPAASDEDQNPRSFEFLQLTAPDATPATTPEDIKKEEDAKMQMDGATDDADMADDEASQLTQASPTAAPVASMTKLLSNTRLGNGVEVSLPVRTAGWDNVADVVE
ncbi:hypothetical protein QBC41DRAFT_261882 [Cercophora samala]|uniref:Uncharacterized protein n=1 Tax=Cercophora samala TaxID=330535 RepID=A0AA39YX17_9PEZI|nr:hypothetical protein QBC41DRAFT_261882 [Cercophora samala]